MGLWMGGCSQEPVQLPQFNFFFLSWSKIRNSMDPHSTAFSERSIFKGTSVYRTPVHLILSNRTSFINYDQNSRTFSHWIICGNDSSKNSNVSVQVGTSASKVAIHEGENSYFKTGTGRLSCICHLTFFKSEKCRPQFISVWGLLVAPTMWRNAKGPFV